MPTRDDGFAPGVPGARMYVAPSRPARTAVMINTGHAHHVTGTALANTEFGIKTVGSPTTTTVEAAPTAAQSQRRAGQARRTVPAEGELPVIFWSSRFVSMDLVRRSGSPTVCEYVMALSSAYERCQGSVSWRTCLVVGAVVKWFRSLDHIPLGV